MATITSRLVSFAPLAVAPAAAYAAVPPSAPRWLAMWSLAIAIYASVKWQTWRDALSRQPRLKRAAPLWRHLGYLIAWPGLDAPTFLFKRTPSPALPREWAFAVVKLLFGGALFWGVARMAPSDWPLVAAWIGMAGIAFVLHFGFFHLLSCVWRSIGVAAPPLMNWPIAATSVSDYWGRRWNIAFRDLTHRFLFRPLTIRIGGVAALFIGFVFSGIIHDLVVSMPPRAGYGGPTLFFALQAAAMLCERSRFGGTIGLGRGLVGRAFTAAAVLLPSPLLFHRPFLERIVLPFMHDLGAWS